MALPAGNDGGTQQLFYGLDAQKLDMMPKDQDGAATIAPRLRHREHKWANLIKIAEDIDKRYTEGRSLPKTVEETLLFAKRVAEFPAEFPKNFGLGKKSTVMTRTPDIFGSSS